VMKKPGSEDDDWRFAQTGLQLAAGVLLGFGAGHWLDGRLGTSPWLMLAGAAAGLAAGFYLFVKEIFHDGGKRE